MSGVDHTTLSWVKKELDETLGQARNALEAFVEDPDDPTQLRFCITHLHQVSGTLQMVELYGASMLAEEMEALAAVLLEDPMKRRDEAYEVLMRAILQLPDYLERLQSGQRDIPIVLLPLVNDLRAAQGKNLLSENTLFNPDLSSLAALTEGGADLDDAPVRALAKSVRPRLQKGLLGWIRNLNRQQAVEEIGQVIAELEHASTLEPVVQLWWLAGGLAEALREEKLDPAISINLVLGQLDREIKRFIDEGELALAERPSVELAKNVLYYVALAKTGGERVDAVKACFNLDAALPKEDEIEEARAGISGRNIEVMQAVTIAVKEDITEVKDSLDLYVRSEQRDPAQLVAMADSLKRIADTLGMLGLGVPRKMVLEQRLAVDEMAQGGREVDDSAIMDVAGILLYVESSLEGDLQQQAEPEEAPEVGGLQLPQAEIAQIQNTVIGEAINNLSRAKEAITNFLEDSSELEPLQAVPLLMDQVQGALQVVSLPRVAELMRQANGYVARELVEAGRTPEMADQEALAEAISGIELYLEGVVERRPNPILLESVAERLERLGCQSAEAERVVEPVETVADEAEEPTPEAVASEAEQEIEPEVAESIPAEVTLDEVESAPLVDVEAEVEAEDKPSETVVAAAEEESSADFAFSDELDDEILDIFVEEAEEEYAEIKEQLPKWLANPDDEESLTTLRRSYHTLKGSGRLVGANLVGEFAWSMENLLNRVIDKTVDLSPAIAALLEAALKALPELLEQIKQGTKPQTDIKGLMARAEALSKPGAAEPIPVVEEAVAASPVATEATAESESEVPAMDPVLYEIFSKESSGHFAEIRRFIAECSAEEECKPTSELARALHTLHGSAHMAGSQVIADTTGRMEKCVNAMQEANAAVDQDAIELMAEVVRLSELVMQQLSKANPEFPDNSTLLTRIDGYTAAIVPVEPEVEARTAPSEAPVESVITPVAEEERFVEHVDLGEQDDELMEIFLEEADEIFESCESVMQEWHDAPESVAPVAALQREIHTLKGGARMANLVEIGDLSHSLEDLLTAIAEGRRAGTRESVEVLQRALDRLHTMLGQAKRREKVDAVDDLLAQLERLQRGESLAEAAESITAPEHEVETEAAEGTEHVVEEPTETAVETAAEVLEAQEPEAEEIAEAAEIAVEEVAEETVVEVAEEADKGDRAARTQQDVVRVRADLLDDMVNFAGEASIYRSRLEQQVGTLRFNLQEMTQTAVRLREQLRELDMETEAQIDSRVEQISHDKHAEFDPLEMDRYTHMQELSRGLSETANDMISIQHMLDNSTRESETLLLQQSRVNTELQEGLMSSRMLPFTGLVTRLRRLMRQTADTVGRQVGFFVKGAEVELDRKVLDRIVAPLEHMLRNAIAHGIEPAAERQASGKPQAGRVEISLAREGAEIVLRMRDDGRGIDVDQVRSKAIERGLMPKGAELTDHAIIQFILASGFSTAATVTQVSGRGVGMDVVSNEIKQLGGSLEIDSLKGEGTTFTIRMPLTLTVNRAIMVQISDENYAIPLTAVEGVTRMSSDDLAAYVEDESKSFDYGGRTYQVNQLAMMLGSRAASLHDGGKMLPILLVRSGNQRTAVQVDRLQGSREVVVKSVGPQLGSVPGVSGATILGDGSVVLILDVGALSRQESFEILMPEATSEAAAVGESSETTVMVVDDSITIRKVTTRLLERNHMRVFTAKDGIDAVAQLQDNRPDLFLLDVEMPRMDGFELATYIRNDSRLKDIPIIMITSRTGEKHRQRAFDIGVNRYLGKPYKEKELLENIGEVLELDHESA